MIPAKINVCGIPYTVKLCKDNFDTDVHFGEVIYSKAEIHINEDMTVEMQAQTLCHEWLHAALVIMGYTDMTNDEKFICCLSNAIDQSFKIKEGTS